MSVKCDFFVPFAVARMFVVEAQAIEDALFGITQEELNEMDPDAVIDLVRNAEEEQGEEDDEGLRDRLSSAELASLSVRSATEHDSGSECSVCLEGMRAGQEVVQLPCAHSFHRPCVVRWLARSRRCPYCRDDVSQHHAAGRGRAGGLQGSIDEERV